MLVEVKKFGKEERVAVTSLDVAETFGKAHKDVLRSIRELGCSEEFNERNFAPVEYTDAKGEQRPAYVMTRDGFTMLVMGYTGETAMRFKEAYIRQFNEMEKLLRGKMLEREKGIAVRQSLTKAIQQSTENDRMHGHAYSLYTDLIYKNLFDMSAAQMRDLLDLKPTDNIRDALSEEKLKAVQTMEQLVSGLLGCGLGYGDVKAYVAQINEKRKMLTA